jgi:Predicted ATP-grasp enzyme
VYGDADFLPVMLGTGLNTYNIARSLHEAYGVRSLALGRVPLRETADSRIVDVRTWPDLDEPGRVVEELLRVAEEFDDRKRLLVANIEHYTNVVQANREVLSEHFLIPLPEPEVAARLMTKAAFARTCAELGVPHPSTVVVPAAEAAAAGFGEDLPFGFPAILKPSDTDLYPRLHFPGKQKVYRIHSPGELREVARRVLEGGYDGELILQELLEGDESVMRVVNTYSDRHGRLRVCSQAQIVLGEYDPQYLGNYNAVVTIEDPALTESVRHLLESIGYRGAANVDVMVDRRTGEAKLLEVNLRQGAASFYTTAAGANIARCYVEDLVHERDLPQVDAEPEVLWVNVPYPFVRALAPKGLRGLVRRARRKGVHHTLRYRHDRSWRRLLQVARLDARVGLGYVRNLRTRPGR